MWPRVMWAAGVFVWIKRTVRSWMLDAISCRVRRILMSRMCWYKTRDHCVCIVRCPTYAEERYDCRSSSMVESLQRKLNGQASLRSSERNRDMRRSTVPSRTRPSTVVKEQMRDDALAGIAPVETLSCEPVPSGNTFTSDGIYMKRSVKLDVC